MRQVPQANGTPTTIRTVESQPKLPPRPVREWAYLLGGITLVAVVGGAALVVVVMARRRARLARLQQDWRTRRAVEKDAWTEAGRRAYTPSASELDAANSPGDKDANVDPNPEEPQ